jgi:flagellar basal body-associated protein FliL
MAQKKEALASSKMGKFSIILFVLSVVLFLVVLALYIFVMPAQMAKNTVVPAQTELPG